MAPVIRLLMAASLLVLATTANAVARVCEPANRITCDAWRSEEPPPRPDRPPGNCEFTVMMHKVVATEGQGVSEGIMEVEVTARAGSGEVTWPRPPIDVPGPVTIHYVESIHVGKPKDADLLVATHSVLPGETKLINICTTVTEFDRGGLNGKSDVGRGCLREVPLFCPLGLDEEIREITRIIEVDLCKGDRHLGLVCKKAHGKVAVVFKITGTDDDADGIPHHEDMTPGPAGDACRGQLGRAVILYSEFGDGDQHNLLYRNDFVNTDVDEMWRGIMQGYDWVGLAVDPRKALASGISQRTLADSDMTGEPTLEGLRTLSRAAVSRGFDITLIIQANGGADTNGVAFITSADVDGSIDENELSAMLDPSVSGTCEIPIRAVHSLAGYGNEFSDAWISAGAKVSGGARFPNFYPQEQNGWVKSWNRGQTFGSAVANQPDQTVRTGDNREVSQTGREFGCSPRAATNVLGHNLCAEGFFTTVGPESWRFSNNGRSDYDPSQTGKTNMEMGSEMVIDGDDTIHKFSGLLTWE